MLLIFHIIVAIAGLIFATLSLVRPSGDRIKTTYGFSLATIFTGLSLMVSRPQVIGHLCISGGLYLGFTAVCLMFARKRLAYER